MKEDSSIVFVIDNDSAVRAALARLLGSVNQPCAIFELARDFFASKRPDLPGCIVLDVQMPEMSGLDFQHELTARKLQYPIIFLTGYGDIPMAVRALKAGAVEFLTKPFQAQELLDAIRKAIDFDREERKKRVEKENLNRHYQSLTPREREVMEMVVSGMSNKQIAAQLGTAERTIKVHRGHVMEKMKAVSLTDLVLMAKSLGVSSLDQWLLCQDRIKNDRVENNALGDKDGARGY